MNIKNLVNTLTKEQQNGLYTNGAATITHVAKVDPQQFRASETASVVYHGSEDYSFPKLGDQGSAEIYIKYSITTEEAAAREAQYSEMGRLLTYGLRDTSAGLRRTYEAAISKLPTELREKDWAFSVANGSLAFTEGKNPLSEQERAMLNEAFSSTNVEYNANRVASTMIRVLELERSSAGGLSKGIGRFDVSSENFADIVDLRAYLLSHGPEGKYGWWQQPEQLNNYDSLYYTGGYAMMDQIAARAAPRFAKT